MGGLDFDRIKSSALRQGDDFGRRDFRTSNDTFDTFPYVDQIRVPENARRSAPAIPFLLSVYKDGSTYKWSVSSENSVITNGTNGPKIDLSSAGFDTESTISASKYIVLELITATAVWTLKAVDLADSYEVKTTGSPAVQTAVRLLIGKVTFATSPSQVYAKQAVFTPQMLTSGFLNGIKVKQFRSWVINQSSL